MKTALKLSQDLLTNLVEENPTGIFVDATIGNGHDIHRILMQPGFKGHVYGFDIQEQALTNTRERLKAFDENNYSLILDSHARIGTYLPPQTELAGGIFNLGYLPGGDKTITTAFASTKAALTWMSEHLQVGGKILLVVYHGHPEGAVEAEELKQYVATYEQKFFQVAQFSFLNQINRPPYLLIIEKIAK